MPDSIVLYRSRNEKMVDEFIFEHPNYFAWLFGLIIFIILFASVVDKFKRYIRIRKREKENKNRWNKR